MARAKKSEENAGSTLQIDIDSFVRSIDYVVTGLQTLQDAITTFSSAYIKHTHAVLGEHGSGIDLDAALAKLGEIPMLKVGDSLARSTSPGKLSAENGPEKKERKKRNHDPNAPKRPLTPFFLYMQTARPIIAKDLGAEAPKGAVSVEGQRRWQTMNEEDKQLWTDAYKENLRLYHARIHSYKAGNANAKEMDEVEAANYAAEHEISVPALDNHVEVPLPSESSAAVFLEEDVEAEIETELQPELEPEQELELEPETESESEPTPVPKTPKPKSSRKQKTKITPDEIHLKSETNAPTSSATTIALPSEKENSPERKRKRSKRKEELMAKDMPNPVVPRIGSKSKKKKAKNE